MATIVLPLGSAAAQCPAYLDSIGFNAWSSTAMMNWATEHWYAAGHLPDGDQCVPILEAAAQGIENARGSCGMYWVDPFRFGSRAGLMPASHLGPDTALILINSQLQPPASGAEGNMPDPHHNAMPGDSVGTREVVTHEALHASLKLRYLLDAMRETHARDDARLCFYHLEISSLIGDLRGTGTVVSPPGRAGLHGMVLALIIVGIAGGSMVARRRRIAGGRAP